MIVRAVMTHSDLSRRDFLRGMTAAGLATLAGGEPRLPRAPSRSSTRSRPPTPASSCGWPAAWPRRRRSTPSATRRSRSASRSRRSSAPSRPSTRSWTTSRSPRGWRTSPRCMDRGTLIRSHVVADLGNILHSRHQYHWHTGYVPPQTVAVPAPRLVDRARPRAAQPGHPAVHQHRPAARRASASRRS